MLDRIRNKKSLVICIVVVVILLASFLGHHTSSVKSSSAQGPTHGLYVALGDSVAAGVGLQDYSDTSACDRTNQSYPNLIAAKLNFHLQSEACSGATTASGLLGQQDVNDLETPPQINAALGNKKPSLITITIGANDAQWTTAIQKCYTDLCGSAADTNQTESEINAAAANLTKALTQIKDTYPTAPPKVVLTGYYRLFPTTPIPNCTELSGIEPAELTWIRQLQDNIDTALQTVTKPFPFATFVPINFTGHELCTNNPWIQQLSDSQPFHPTDAGQTAIANQVVAALNAHSN